MRKEEARVHLTATVVSSEKVPHFIGQILRPQLPYSLPLLRRCQHHATRGTQSSDAEIWWATATDQPEFDVQSQVPTEQYERLSGKCLGFNAHTAPSGVESQDGERSADLRDGHHWLAAHIDLSNSGQTQVWIFASWEAEFMVSSDSVSAIRESRDYPIFKALFDALFSHIRQVHVPKLGRDPPPQWQRLKDTGKIVSIPFSRSKVLFGTLAECHWGILNEYGSTDEEGVSRLDKGYLKYIFTPKASSLLSISPPATLNFRPMEDGHLQMILDRTNIPRTIETLRQLHIVALFNQDKVPVAWGMLGKDASISSLHTEPEYRRQGLAAIVSRRLFADQIKLFMDDTDPGVTDTVVYAHADVSAVNLASRKVMEKLGGKVMWNIAWMEVELGDEASG